MVKRYPLRAAVLFAACVLPPAAVASGCGQTVLVLLESDKADAARLDGGSDGAFADGEAPGLRCPDASPVNALCTRSAECCSGWCAPGATLELSCRPATGCLGAGAPCSRAGACCSTGCFANGGPPVCAGESACLVVGVPCTADHDCCSNVCAGNVCTSAGAGCRPAGELCGADSECCGRVCVQRSDGELEGGTCELLQGCRAEGETCTTASDCCSTRCVTDATDVLRCAALEKCTGNDDESCTRQVGDVCKDGSDCCSKACVTTGDGTKRCIPSGGCRAECELCATNGDCCSGACEMGADDVKRCKAGPCGLRGEACDKDDDCCSGIGLECSAAGPGSPKRCRPGGSSACLEEGATCALTTDCCSGRCVPGGDGTLQCRSACVPYGGACTTRGDCCGAPGADCMMLAGTLVCAPLAR